MINHFVSCTTYKYIPPKDACKNIRKEIWQSSRPCNDKDCHYSKCYQTGGWWCCQCDQGPHLELICEKNINPDWMMEVFECGHQICDKCLTQDAWEAKQKEKKKLKENKEKKDADPEKK